MTGIALDRFGARWREFAAGRMVFRREAAPVYRLLALQAALVVGLVAVLGFTVSRADFSSMLTLLGLAVGAAAAVRWIGFDRPADILEAGAALLGASMAVGCLSVLLATIGAPWRDAALDGADRLLFPFLSWPAMAGALARRPLLIAAMCRVYSTLLWQPFLLVGWLAWSGRRRELWRWLHAWLLALIACLAVFALAPAMSAQVHHHVTPDRLPGLSVDAGWRPAALLTAIRSGAMRELASSSMAGMIDFPSFHTAGALLLGWGFAQTGKLGRPLVGLNVAMLPTIPLVGSHYFVDMLAGALVALVAILGTRRSRGGDGDVASGGLVRLPAQSAGRRRAQSD